MHEVVILSSSSEEEGGEAANLKKAKDENFIQIWKLAKEIISFDTSNDKRSTFPYEKFTYLSNQIQKISGEKFLSSKGVFLWNHLLQWVEAMKLSDDDIKDLKYDEKFNFTLIDLMAQFINFKCEYLHRKRRKEKQMEQTERDKEINIILNALFIIFDGKFSHIIMTLLKIEIKKDYAFILYPVFRKYLTDKNLHQPHRFMSYVPLILCYKQWKRLVGFAAEKEEINQEALKILPADVPVIHAGNPFAGISETITYAAKRKKQKDGTRCILLNNKDMDLDGVIDKYFKQYEIYITRCETANVHSLKDYDPLATECNHLSTYEPMRREVIKPESRGGKKSYQKLKQSKTRDNCSLRNRCINNKNMLRKNLSKNIEVIELDDTTENDSEEDIRFNHNSNNNSSRIVPFSNQQQNNLKNNLKNKTLDLDKTITETKANNTGDESDVIIIEEDKNITNDKVKSRNSLHNHHRQQHHHLKEKLSRRKAYRSQNITECISSSDDENNSEQQPKSKKNHRNTNNNSSNPKETANTGLKSIKQGLILNKPINKFRHRPIKNSKSSEQNVVLGEVSSTTDHEINLKIAKPSQQTPSLEVDSSGFTENEKNIREVGSGVLNIMPTPYFRNNIFLNESASSDIGDDISEDEDAEISDGIKKKQNEKQIKLYNTINKRFLVDNKSMEKTKTSKVDSTSVGTKTNEDDLPKTKNCEIKTAVSGYSILKPKSLFNNNSTSKASSMPSTSKQAFFEDATTNSSPKIISIKKTMTANDIKEVSSTEQNVRDGFKIDDNTSEPCLVSTSVYGVSKVLFSTNRTKPLPLDHNEDDDDSQVIEDDYSEQRNCDTPLLDERQISFSGDEAGNCNTAEAFSNDKSNVSLVSSNVSLDIQNNGQCNNDIPKLQEKSFGYISEEKSELSLNDHNTGDIKAQSILKTNLHVSNSSSKPKSKENTSKTASIEKSNVPRNPNVYLVASTSRKSSNMEHLTFNDKTELSVFRESKNINQNLASENVNNVSCNKDLVARKDHSSSNTNKPSKFSDKSNKAQSSKSETFMTVLGLKKQSTLLDTENSEKDKVSDEAKVTSLRNTNLNFEEDTADENRNNNINKRDLGDLKSELSVELNRIPDSELSDNNVLVSKENPETITVENKSSLDKVPFESLNKRNEKFAIKKSQLDVQQGDNNEKSENMTFAMDTVTSDICGSSTVLNEPTKSFLLPISAENEVNDGSDSNSGHLSVSDEKGDKSNAMLQEEECTSVLSDKITESLSLPFTLKSIINDKDEHIQTKDACIHASVETEVAAEKNSDYINEKLKSIKPEVPTKKNVHKDVKPDENKSEQQQHTESTIQVPNVNEIQTTEERHLPKGTTNVSGSSTIIKDLERENSVVEENTSDKPLKTYQENSSSTKNSEKNLDQLRNTEPVSSLETDLAINQNNTEIIVKDDGNDKVLVEKIDDVSNLEKSQNVPSNSPLTDINITLPVQKGNNIQEKTIEPEHLLIKETTIESVVNPSTKLNQKCSHTNCGNTLNIMPDDSFLPNYVQETRLGINNLVVNEGGYLEYSEDSTETSCKDRDLKKRKKNHRRKLLGANKTKNDSKKILEEDKGKSSIKDLCQEYNLKEHVKESTDCTTEDSSLDKINRKDMENTDLSDCKNKHEAEDDLRKLTEIDKIESLSLGNEKDLEKLGPNSNDSVGEDGMVDHNSKTEKKEENIDTLVESENKSLNIIKSVDVQEIPVSVVETANAEERSEKDDITMESTDVMDDTIKNIDTIVNEKDVEKLGPNKNDLKQEDIVDHNSEIEQKEENMDILAQNKNRSLNTIKSVNTLQTPVPVLGTGNTEKQSDTEDITIESNTVLNDAIVIQKNEEVVSQLEQTRNENKDEPLLKKPEEIQLAASDIQKSTLNETISSTCFNNELMARNDADKDLNLKKTNEEDLIESSNLENNPEKISETVDMIKIVDARIEGTTEKTSIKRLNIEGRNVVRMEPSTEEIEKIIYDDNEISYIREENVRTIDCETVNTTNLLENKNVCESSETKTETTEFITSDVPSAEISKQNNDLKCSLASDIVTPNLQIEDNSNIQVNIEHPSDENIKKADESDSADIVTEKNISDILVKEKLTVILDTTKNTSNPKTEIKKIEKSDSYTPKEEEISIDTNMTNERMISIMTEGGIISALLKNNNRREDNKKRPQKTTSSQDNSNECKREKLLNTDNVEINYEELNILPSTTHQSKIVGSSFYVRDKNTLGEHKKSDDTVYDNSISNNSVPFKLRIKRRLSESKTGFVNLTNSEDLDSEINIDNVHSLTKRATLEKVKNVDYDLQTDYILGRRNGVLSIPNDKKCASEDTLDRKSSENQGTLKKPLSEKCVEKSKLVDVTTQKDSKSKLNTGISVSATDIFRNHEGVCKKLTNVEQKKLLENKDIAGSEKIKRRHFKSKHANKKEVKQNASESVNTSPDTTENMKETCSVEVVSSKSFKATTVLSGNPDINIVSKIAEQQNQVEDNNDTKQLGIVSNSRLENIELPKTRNSKSRLQKSEDRVTLEKVKTPMDKRRPKTIEAFEQSSVHSDIKIDDEPVQQSIQKPDDNVVSKLLLEHTECSAQQKSNHIVNSRSDENIVTVKGMIPEIAENSIPKNKSTEKDMPENYAVMEKPKNKYITSNKKLPKSESANILQPCVDNSKTLTPKSDDKERTKKCELKKIENKRTGDIEITNAFNVKKNSINIDTSKKIPSEKPEVNPIRNLKSNVEIVGVSKLSSKKFEDVSTEKSTEKKTNKKSKIENIKHSRKTENNYVKSSRQQNFIDTKENNREQPCSDSNETLKLKIKNSKIIIDLKQEQSEEQTIQKSNPESSQNLEVNLLNKEMETKNILDSSLQNAGSSKLSTEKSEAIVVAEKIKSKHDDKISEDIENTETEHSEVIIKSEIESVDSLEEPDQKPEDCSFSKHLINQINENNLISIEDRQQAISQETQKFIPETNTINSESVLVESTHETDKSETESIPIIIHGKRDDKDTLINKSVVESKQQTMQESVSDIQREPLIPQEIRNKIESPKENQILKNLPPKQIKKQQSESIENLKQRKETPKTITETGVRRGRGRRNKPYTKKRAESPVSNVISSDFIKQAFPQLTNYNVNKEKVDGSVPNSNIENFDNLALLSNSAAQVSPLKIENNCNISEEVTNKNVPKITKGNLKSQLKVRNSDMSTNDEPTKPKKRVHFALDTFESKDEIPRRKLLTSPKMNRSCLSPSSVVVKDDLNLKSSSQSGLSTSLVSTSCDDIESPVVSNTNMCSPNKLVQKSKLNSSTKSIDEISSDLLTKGLHTKQPDSMCIVPPSINYDQGMSLPHKSKIDIQNMATKTSEKTTMSEATTTYVATKTSETTTTSEATKTSQANKKIHNGKFLVMSNKEAKKIINNIDDTKSLGSFVITPINLARARQDGGMKFYLSNNDNKTQNETLGRDILCNKETQKTPNSPESNAVNNLHSMDPAAKASEKNSIDSAVAQKDTLKYAQVFEKTANILSGFASIDPEHSISDSKDIEKVKNKRLGMYIINSTNRKNNKKSGKNEMIPDSTTILNVVPPVPTIETLEINKCTKNASHIDLNTKKQDSLKENQIIQNLPKGDQLDEEDKGKIIPEDGPPKKVPKIKIIDNIRIFPGTDLFSMIDLKSTHPKNDVVTTTSSTIVPFPIENCVTSKKSDDVLSQRNKLRKTAKKHLNFDQPRQVIKLKGDAKPLIEIGLKSHQLIEQSPIALQSENEDKKSNNTFTNESLGVDGILQAETEEPVKNEIKPVFRGKTLSTYLSEVHETTELVKNDDSVKKENTTDDVINVPNDLPEDLFSDSPIKITTNIDALKMAIKTANETDNIENLPNCVEKISEEPPKVDDSIKSISDIGKFVEAKSISSDEYKHKNNKKMIPFNNFKTCFVKLKRLKHPIFNTKPVSLATSPPQTANISKDLDDTPCISLDVNKPIKKGGKLKRRSSSLIPDIAKDDSKIIPLPPKIPKLIATPEIPASCWQNEISFLNEYANLLQLKNLFNCLPLIKVLESFQRTSDVNTYFLLNKIFVTFLYECFSSADFDYISERKRLFLCTMTKKLQETNIDDASLHEIEQKYIELKKNWPKTRPSKKNKLLDEFITKFKIIKKSLFDANWTNQYSTSVQLMSKNMPIENKFLTKITDNLESKNLNIIEEKHEILPETEMKQACYEKLENSPTVNDRIKSPQTADLDTVVDDSETKKETLNTVNIDDQNQISKLEIDTNNEKPNTNQTNENDSIQEDDDFQSKNGKDTTTDLSESDTEIVITETFRSLKEIERIYDPITDMDDLQKHNEMSSIFLKDLENCDEVFNEYSGKTKNGATDCMISGKFDVRETNADIAGTVADISNHYNILEEPLLEVEVETSPPIATTSNNQGDDTLKPLSSYYSFDSKYSFDPFFTNDTTPNKCDSVGFDLLNGTNDPLNDLDLFGSGIVNDLLDSLKQDNPTESTTNNENPQLNIHGSSKSSNISITNINDSSKITQIPENKEECSNTQFTALSIPFQEKLQNEERSDEFKYCSKDLPKTTSSTYGLDSNKPTKPDPNIIKSKIQLLPSISKTTNNMMNFVIPSNKVIPDKSLSPASKLKSQFSRFWKSKSPTKESSNTKSTLPSLNACDPALKGFRKPKQTNSSLDPRPSNSTSTATISASSHISQKEIFHMPDLGLSKAVGSIVKNVDPIILVTKNQNPTQIVISKINKPSGFVSENHSTITEAPVKISSSGIHPINKRRNSEISFQNNIKICRIEDPFDKLKNDTNSSIPLPRKTIPLDATYRNENNKERLKTSQTSIIINNNVKTNSIESGKELKSQTILINKAIVIVPHSTNHVKSNIYTAQQQQQHSINSQHNLRLFESGKDGECRLDTRQRQPWISRSESLNNHFTPHSNNNHSNSNYNISHSNQMKSAGEWEPRNIDNNQIIDDLRKGKKSKSHKRVYVK